MKSSNEWEAMAKQVAEGKNFQNQFFRLSADIDTKGIQVGSMERPFCGTFGGWGSWIGGLVGLSEVDITFKNCMFDPVNADYQGNATFVNLANGAKATFENCYCTRYLQTEQGQCVFSEVGVHQLQDVTGPVHLNISDKSIPAPDGAKAYRLISMVKNH